MDILRMVSGDYIIFKGHPPIQHSSPPNTLPHSERERIEDAIQSLLTKQVIAPCQYETCEFVSPIFTVPKKDGTLDSSLI